MDFGSIKLGRWMLPFFIIQFLGYSPNLPKNKIKGVGVDRKIKVKILDVFYNPVVPLFCPEIKENTNSMLK